jgi:hypothetical protein
VGAFPRAPGGFRFLFIAIDTFIKWMEAMPVVNITQDASVKFLDSIIYRFGVPKWVLTDNRTQFKGHPIYSSKVHKVLARFWYQPSGLFRCTPSDERPSRAGQRAHIAKDENKDVSRSRSERKKLVKGATLSIMGIVH